MIKMVDYGKFYARIPGRSTLLSAKLKVLFEGGEELMEAVQM